MSTSSAPVRALKNQYRGINAHLHSFWQATGTWGRFHNAFITHLTEALRLDLLPRGYIVEMEESLQIRRVGPELLPGQRPRADTIIYDPDRQRAAAPSAIAEAPLTVADLLDDAEDVAHPYYAVAIYPSTPDLTMGDAIVWIELLSPSNKGYSPDAQAYQGKRRALLDAGLAFVELDFLHATPPTFARLPDYTRGEAGASPYRVALLDPRPDVQRGPAEVHEFVVDEPIPDITLRLSGEDRATLGLDRLYQAMIARGYAYQAVDYAQLPLEFERYSPADQARIARRMLAVVEAARAGHDLNAIDVPLAVGDLSLDDALAALDGDGG
jgi:hypothetical protein